jgi:hypothetical protein
MECEVCKFILICAIKQDIKIYTICTKNESLRAKSLLVLYHGLVDWFLHSILCACWCDLRIKHVKTYFQPSILLVYLILIVIIKIYKY